MSSPSPPVLQRLHHLNRSSPNFHDQLSNVLYGQEYQQCALNLEGDDVVWLVDYLDQALDRLDPSSSASRKCLRELRSICGARATLPTSYSLSSNFLTIDPEPFAFGGSGDVHKGTLDGSRVCIKRVRVYTREGPQKAAKVFCQEAVMWKRLVHPNIVPLLGITVTPPQLISDWMSGGDLPEYIKKNSDADRLGLLSDVAQGLHYLHSRNVIHGDLKGPNILVDATGRARIADFGLAKVTQNLDSMQSASYHHGHTARWAAPEVLYKGTHSKEADIFSFAMVMIEVFTGAIPFSGSSPVTAMLAITQGQRPPRPTHPTFTESLWALMQRCWSHTPHSRPEVSEVLRVLLTPDDPTWRRLISHTLSTHERISLVTTIFSDYNQVEIVKHLSGDDAQNFIDTIYNVLDDLAPEIRRNCLRYLHRICGHRALVPRSLQIPLCYDPTEHPSLHGVFADVWKGQYRGQMIAAKVLRISPMDHFGPIRRRFCAEVVTWQALRHPNVLPLLGVTMSNTRFVMVSEWMDNGDINEFLEAHANADRLKLLRDATRGLIYMHDQGIIHGDLKGANILIDNNGHACLAGFNPLTLFSDQSTVTLPAMGNGTLEWMSPELFKPNLFGLRDSRPTKESDYYGLGMMIYEVLSGRTPFSQYSQFVIVVKVLEGERPERPRGAEGTLFTDDIWCMLELCWKAQPRERMSAQAVLQVLEGNSSVLGPPSSLDKYVESDIDSQPDAVARENRLRRNDDKRPAPPQKDGLKGGWVDRLTRKARKTFKAIARKFRRLRQARRASPR